MSSLLNAVGTEALIEEVDVNLLRGGGGEDAAGEAQQQSVRGHHGAAGLRTV